MSGKMELRRLDSDRSPEFTSHIMESLFFSMSVYALTREAVLLEIHERYGKVEPLVDYGFEEEGKQVVFVARSCSTRRIVVACRGTVGFGDVLQDLKYLQSRLSFVKGAAAHWGFAERAESVPIDFLCNLLADGEELIFTGHSLGGAVASLLSLKVLESNKGKYDEQVHCITFGCPLFASCRLAQLINSKYKDVFTHIVSRRDIVPKILPVISTLQKLVYADEDHLEGLFILKRALELLPWFPIASLSLGVERRIPTLCKFLIRCFLKVALPTGMTGSYAFAGHVVMLDTEATVEEDSLVLASADEMNAWYSQLGFAFGHGFDVKMVEEHTLERYYNSILRNYLHSHVKRGLLESSPKKPYGVPEKIHEYSDSPGGVRSEKLGSETIVEEEEQLQTVIFRLVPQETEKSSVEALDVMFQGRFDSSSATSSVSVSRSNLQQGAPSLRRWESALEAKTPFTSHAQRDGGARRSRIARTLTRTLTRTGSELLARTLPRTKSECGWSPPVRAKRRPPQLWKDRSSSWSKSEAWTSISERRKDGRLVTSVEQTVIRCRACKHLQKHMNIDACRHQVVRTRLGFSWFLGTIGKVARHLRILDNVCYLTFIRILLANVVG